MDLIENFKDFELDYIDNILKSIGAAFKFKL